MGRECISTWYCTFKMMSCILLLCVFYTINVCILLKNNKASPFFFRIYLYLNTCIYKNTYTLHTYPPIYLTYKHKHTHTHTHIKPYNNTNIKCTLSEYKTHIMPILSAHYSLLLEDPMSISSLVSSLEVSSISISSSSLLPSPLY